MADTVRQVAYFYVQVPHRAGESRESLAHCDVRVRKLRRQLGLSQAKLARVVGAAHKAVVYKWESRKRCPSQIFWARIEKLTPPA